MISWDEFESKHRERLQKAFEDLTYHLFCYEFNNGKGIHRYHNQKAIETDPIKNDDDCIGFQTKVYDVPLSSKKAELIGCINDAKETYPNLTKLVFYIYKEYGQSSNQNQNKPKYIKEIEKHGNKKGIKIIWKVRSELERMLQEPENILLYYIFFEGDFDEIHSLESFIDNFDNKLRPDLKNNYSKIDIIHNNLIETIENNKITSISGKQTIGKTRLSIEVAKELSEKENVNTLIITFPTYNLITNLKKIIRPDKKYLIIFDNYTKNYQNLYHIIDKFWNYGNNIKFIFTLKKPYISSLKEELNDFGVTDFPLDAISDEEMRNIIRKSSRDYGLTLKHSTINDLINKSKGNIGVCLMAIRLIKEGSYNSINNYEDIYKTYFNNSKLNKISKEGKRFLGVLSFFENINFKNKDLLNKISEIFSINLIEDIELIKHLSSDEIIDWSDNSIYFSDSILSTYLFYLTFIDEELLSLHDLIINFIKDYSYVLNNRIYDVLNIFGKDSIENLKISQLNPAKSKLNDKELDLFYITFYYIYVDEITSYILNWINSIEYISEFNKDEFEIPDKFRHLTRRNKLTLLSRLFYTENQILGLELTIELILKRQTLLGDILYSLKENYSYDLYNIENNFKMQNEFLDFIESEFDENRQVIVDNIFLFILSENRFFSLRHTQHRQTTKPYESEILEIDIPSSKSWSDLRIRFLKNLFRLYDKYPVKVEDIFDYYINSIYKDYNSLYENEEEIVFDFLTKLDYTKYKANKLAYLYSKRMKEINANLKNDYKFIDSNIIENISLYSDILDRYPYPEYEEKVDNITKHIKDNYDYENAFNLMKEINTREKRCRVYCDELLHSLLKLNFNTFVDAFKYYMSNNFGILTDYRFMHSLMDYENQNLDCYNLINSFDYEEQNNLNYIYFQYLPEDYVNEAIFNHFIDFIKISPNNVNFFFIERYLKFDKIFHELIEDDSSNFIQFIIKIILPNIDEKTQINVHHFCEENIRYFERNMELLEDFYLKNISIENYDYEFKELKVLCENNREFIFKYFEYRLKYNDEFFKDRNQKIRFIWDLNYEFEEIEYLINYLNENYKYITSEAVNLLFSNTTAKEKEFIKYYIKNNHNHDTYMRVMFKIIKFNYTPDEYLEFLEEFLILNDNLETFKLLMAPYFSRKLYNEKMFLEEQISFFEEIKKLLSEIKNPLKYLGHKLYLNEKIDEVKEKLRKKDYF